MIRISGHSCPIFPTICDLTNNIVSLGILDTHVQYSHKFVFLLTISCLICQATEITIPLKSDGSKYSLDSLMDDQRAAIVIILMKLKEWLAHLEFDENNNLQTFQPLRLTVMGAAGTGKSVLINTLVTVLRTMFGSNDVVQVAAPTGTAAFNVGGETLHRLFSILVDDDFCSEQALSAKRMRILVSKFQRLVALIIDERSMMGLKLFGSACANVKQFAHGGGHDEEDWGGVPIVMIVGDDFQLPPSFGKGAFDILVRCGGQSQVEALGAEQFLSCASNVIELQAVKRQQESQVEFKEFLETARASDIDEDAANTLINQLSLHKNNRYTQEEKDEIFKDSLFISANVAPVAEFNLMRLSRECSVDNPVAVVKSKLVRQSQSGKTHAFPDSVPLATLMCIGCLVSICGRNFEPKWGLHNGAIGVVKEIVFNEGESPLQGDLPLYVVVEFMAYCGPVWDKENPKVSPNVVPLLVR